ncbi:WD40-repeat-containing domain protein [Dichotomocladium elegans]|nr:WD40-repeat-containing domain protein [Dichotomocladium elegans]
MFYRSSPGSTTKSSTKQYPVLGVKMSRPCNVVSFSSTHPHLLAAGLDKVRNDPCLLVWDISQAIDAPAGTQTSSTPSYYQNYRPQSARSTTALDREALFSGKQNNILPHPQIPARPIQQYGPSEAIASCAWSSHGGAPLLIAGMGNKYLRVYDIRGKPSFSSSSVDSMATPLQFATKAVYGAAVDPFNPNRLASYTEEGVVKLWDLRKKTDPISFFHSLSRIAFSPSRPGLLASLSRDAFSINLWDIQESSSLKATMATGDKSPLLSLAEIPEDELSIPVLWKSRRSTTSSKPIACFSFIPKHASSCRSNMSVLTMQKDNQFETINLEEACKMAWRPTGGLLLTGGSDMETRFITSDSRAFGFRRVPAEGEGNPKLELLTPTLLKEAATELANDISVVMRERVKMGYAMECRKNLGVVKDDWKMKELWSWVECADILAHDTTQRIEYNFQGVHSLWMSTAVYVWNAHLATDLSKNSNKDKMLVLQERTEDMLAMVETAKPIQRNIALKVCGFGFTQAELEEELVRLESRGEYDKAAGWAFFGGLPHRAIQALNSGRGSGENDQQRKLMSAVLAGFQPNTLAENPTWRALCESLSEDMVDRPYLRAIFAYISSNDWFRVLNEPKLSLKERVAVALRVLDDQQLTEYLDRLTAQLISEGDVEGVLLTGLTPQAVDLFEQTVNRYGDVQTASLVMSFVVPRRFKDKRVEDWTER